MIHKIKPLNGFIMLLNCFAVNNCTLIFMAIGALKNVLKKRNT